ncbi:multiprotein-bridging factor 1 family protein [Leifsonia sp. NPDC058248]|uniref:helix-turn-helix domain-containing protein n=1 Tax=Leifsonia sp. NPDC058248 TaxID=3346402 RepID=UPI0036D8709C
MPASTLLRGSRNAARLDQTALSSRAGDHQSDISSIERGRRIPRVDTLERLLASTGHKLISLPSTSPSTIDVSDRIRRHVKTGDRDGALRGFLDFADGLAREPGNVRIALTIAAPLKTGSLGWDAALAGLVELRLNEVGLPHPEWVSIESTRAPSPQTPHLSEYDLDPRIDSVPTEFASRNVLIERGVLASV